MLNRLVIPGVILLISVACAISAAVACVVAALQSPPLLFMIGLELGVIAAGVMGVLIGLGKFKEGRAISVLCVGAAFVVCSYLTLISANRVVGGVDLLPFRNARMAAGGLLILIAALSVLLRRPNLSLPRLALGVALLVPLVAGGLWIARGGALAFFSTQGQIVQITAIFVAFVAFCGLASASGHFLIRAFAIGVEAGEAESAARHPA